MSGNKTDHRAEHGYQPSWRLQRKKQEAMAEGFYDDYESDKTDNE